MRPNQGIQPTHTSCVLCHQWLSSTSRQDGKCYKVSMGHTTIYGEMDQDKAALAVKGVGGKDLLDVLKYLSLCSSYHSLSQFLALCCRKRS